MKNKKIALLTLSAALAATLAVPAVAVAAGNEDMARPQRCMLQGERVACAFAGETGKVAHHIRACMGQFAAGAGFVDADGDGVCDNRADGSLGRGGYGFVDADGNGICDNRENGSYAGAGFVDADGDGVCDNRGEGSRSHGENAPHHGRLDGQQRHACLL